MLKYYIFHCTLNKRERGNLRNCLNKYILKKESNDKKLSKRTMRIIISKIRKTNQERER